ncbi:MAG: hypothetical protein HND47_00935 [Chloroflexi bacterium]|nr:hypothetical protein [Chloroflexota bacterium]
MLKLLPYIVKPLFALFCLVVAAGVLYFSFNALGLIFPDDLAGQLLGLALFDIGMAVWFVVFLKNCKSTMQYVWSVFGFLIGLAGTLGLVSMEVGASSGLIDPTTLAKPLTYTFVGVLVGHLLLTYAFHASSPEQSVDISIGIEKAKITDEAQKQVEKKIAEKIPVLADAISEDLLRGVIRDLNLRVRPGTTLDLPAFDVVEPVQEKQEGAAPIAQNFLSSLFAWAVPGGRKFQSSAPSVELNSKAVTPKRSPAATDAESDDPADVEPKK